jgi:hypothetical protein
LDSLLGVQTVVVRLVAALAAVCLLVGCNGGTVDRHALTNDAATVDSLNCEAWLLAREVARARLTSAYTTEQAKALALQASNLADALSHRPTSPGLEPRVRAKARDAARAAARLHTLSEHPTDRARGAELAGRFKRAGSCS